MYHQPFSKTVSVKKKKYPSFLRLKHGLFLPPPTYVPTHSLLLRPSNLEWTNSPPQSVGGANRKVYNKRGRPAISRLLPPVLPHLLEFLAVDVKLDEKTEVTVGVRCNLCAGGADGVGGKKNGCLYCCVVGP